MIISIKSIQIKREECYFMSLTNDAKHFLRVSNESNCLQGTRSLIRKKLVYRVNELDLSLTFEFE